jgi:DNA repair protein RecO (recombination protein O)
LTLRYFELHLLELAGYRPQLQECVSCRMELKPVANAFCSRAGGILCPNCQYEHPDCFSISVDALKVLRLFQRSSFDIVGRLKISQELGQELKNVLASYIFNIFYFSFNFFFFCLFFIYFFYLFIILYSFLILFFLYYFILLIFIFLFSYFSR